MSNNFQALEIYVQTNIASCVLGTRNVFGVPKLLVGILSSKVGWNFLYKTLL